MKQIDIKEAHKALACALLENPDDPHTLIAQMALLFDNGEPGNWPHVGCLARRAWLNAPDDFMAMFNYASSLNRTGHFRQAVNLFKRCVERNDEGMHTSSLHHLGIAYRSLGWNREAVDCYEQAIARAPDRLDYKIDLAMALLADDDWQRGLEVYEARKKLAEEKLKRNDGKLVNQHKAPPGIHWQGEGLEGRSILVYHEDGIGDFIHFCRFVPMLRERGAGAIQLTGPVPGLLELVADNIAIDAIVPMDGPFINDYVVGSMSVPRLCGARLEDVSGKPYFQAGAAEFRRRAPLEIGVVWRGNPAYPKDHFRSMPLSAMCPLFEMPGVAFYSLQIGDGAEEIHKLGFAGFIGDLAPHARSWRDTASLIKRLDAIVTVDTAVAHLAGALGVPVFILITNACDWRWPRNKLQTRWYDSARIIRQRVHNDWTPCIGLARIHLKDMLHARRGQGGAGDRQGAASEAVA